MRKLLLVNPLNKRRIGLIRDNESIYPPMALGIIAALTPDHWEVEILDENFEKFEYREADLVGFTALTASVNRAYELAGIYRKKGVPTVIGGIHVSMLPEEAFDYVDVVVKGEAESVWKDVISDLENGCLKKLYGGGRLPLVKTPKPRIDLYNDSYMFGSVQTTRGCPMQCDFCSVHTFNGNCYRSRPVEDVVEEFSLIPQERVYFIDDNLVGYNKKSAERVIDICKGIVEKGIKKDWFCSCSMNVADNEDVLDWMSKAGCRMIFLGIESELVDQLEATNKKLNMKIGVDNFAKVYDRLHKYGIAVLGAFIFGLDSDTPDTILKRTRYILDSDIDAMQATILTPLPGTLLYDRMKSEGRLIYTNYPDDWERYHFAEVVFKPGNITAKELQEASNQAWELMYDDKMLKRKIIKTLKNTRSTVAATWAYASNLQYRNLSFETQKERIDIKDMFFQITNTTDK